MSLSQFAVGSFLHICVLGAGLNTNWSLYMLFFIIVLTSLVVPIPRPQRPSDSSKSSVQRTTAYTWFGYFWDSNDAPASISVITASVLFWWNILHLVSLNLWPRNRVRGLNTSLPGSIMADSLQVFSWVLKGRILETVSNHMRVETFMQS